MTVTYHAPNSCAERANIEKLCLSGGSMFCRRGLVAQLWPFLRVRTAIGRMYT